MIVLLLILSTGRQSLIVIAVFFMKFVEMFQGYFIEKSIMRPDLSSAYLLVFIGWILFAASWIPVVTYLHDAANSMPDFSRPPESDGTT